MPVIHLVIGCCNECIWKTEYYGDPDYWKCDQADRLLEDLTMVPTWCPLNNLPENGGEENDDN